MKPFLVIALLVPLSAVARTAVTFTNTFNVSTAIPDNDPLGYTSYGPITPGIGDTPSAGEISTITSVTVTLDFIGGWNGDLYIDLAHESGVSILLNRIGRDAPGSDGSATSGFSITLDDNALTDIHQPLETTGYLTGTYQPDGRKTDPDDVLASDERNALLGSFNGLNAIGEWSLFVADLSTGSTSAFQSWALTITAVPEPATAFLALGAALPLLRRKR